MMTRPSSEATAAESSSSLAEAAVSGLVIEKALPPTPILPPSRSNDPRPLSTTDSIGRGRWVGGGRGWQRGGGGETILSLPLTLLATLGGGTRLRLLLAAADSPFPAGLLLPLDEVGTLPLAPEALDSSKKEFEPR
jgi:hypothetical protein